MQNKPESVNHYVVIIFEHYITIGTTQKKTPA